MFIHYRNQTISCLICLCILLSSCSNANKLDALNKQDNNQDSAVKPNILWLTFEDTSAYELSTYGNQNIQTPNIDALAKTGIRFNHAASNAPYCSPARSTLISGVYATSYGVDHHRAPIKPSPQRIYFPALMREAGYFTSNNKKRDYNTKLSKKELATIWDEYDDQASYNSAKRQSKQPFFSVFNANITHMSRLTSYTLKERRDFSLSGVKPGAAPDYLPALKEVASDHQFHLEGVGDIDTWINLFIKDLKQKGLYDNTIIFVFSDHGGSSPRGKGFLYQSTGLNIPFVLHVPPAYQHLLKQPPEVLANKQVSFVDFAPSVLSLAGIPTPKEMQGQAFLGKYSAHDRTENYSFRTNQEKHYDPQRAVTDGHYSYVKSYLNRKPLQLRNDFQWGMPANIALDTFVKTPQGQDFAKQYYRPKKTEYLFDLKQDKFEQHDLSQSPKKEHQAALVNMRKLVAKHIRNTTDLGFLPLSMKSGKPFKEWSLTGFNWQTVYPLAEKVSQGKIEDLPTFKENLSSNVEVLRFWAVQGYAELAANGSLQHIPIELTQAANDPNQTVATIAKEALVYLQAPNAIDQLLNASEKQHRRSALETIAWTKPHLLHDHIRYFTATDNEESRVVLAALGQLPASGIASPKKVAKGLRVNRDRRSLKPTPH